MKLPEVGQRIWYRTKTAQRGTLEVVERIGVVQCIWTNGWDGPHIQTDTGHCIPALGDIWKVHDV